MNEVLREQVAYYRARAGDYDVAYAQRMGLEFLWSEVAGSAIDGDVLELACGTGQWTRYLVDRASTLTALDAAPEMLAVARERMADASVTFVEADVFQWVPLRRYDTVFFAFWLTHVPRSHFAAFWAMLRQALKPGGRVVFVDDGPRKAEIETPLPGPDPTIVRRELVDGTVHRAVKVLHEPQELTAALVALGWTANVRASGPYHVIGEATPRDAD